MVSLYSSIKSTNIYKYIFSIPIWYTSYNSRTLKNIMYRHSHQSTFLSRVSPMPPMHCLSQNSSFWASFQVLDHTTQLGSHMVRLNHSLSYVRHNFLLMLCFRWKKLHFEKLHERKVPICMFFKVSLCTILYVNFKVSARALPNDI